MDFPSDIQASVELSILSTKCIFNPGPPREAGIKYTLVSLLVKADRRPSVASILSERSKRSSPDCLLISQPSAKVAHQP